MTIPVHLQGGNGNLAQVSRGGAVMVSQNFSTAEKITLIADDTALTIITPRAGERMIITGLIVNTDRNIGVNGAAVQIYESDGEDSSVASTAILSFDIPKSTTVVTSPLLIETTQGKFINAISDDSSVNVTLLCYFEDT